MKDTQKGVPKKGKAIVLKTVPPPRDGIRAIEDVRQRCRVDEETGCWIWRGRSNGQKWTSVWLPALSKRVTMGVALGYLSSGGKLRSGQYFFCTCSTHDCANPAHRRWGTRSEQILYRREKRPPQSVVRMIQSQRAQSKITQQDVEYIRNSNESYKTLMERFGIGHTLVHGIRKGRAWRPLAERSTIFGADPKLLASLMSGRQSPPSAGDETVEELIYNAPYGSGQARRYGTKPKVQAPPAQLNWIPPSAA